MALLTTIQTQNAILTDRFYFLKVLVSVWTELQATHTESTHSAACVRFGGKDVYGIKSFPCSYNDIVACG